MWHEWNANADDVMMMWFTLYVNPSDVMPGMCDMCADAWGTCSMYNWCA